MLIGVVTGIEHASEDGTVFMSNFSLLVPVEILSVFKRFLTCVAL